MVVHRHRGEAEAFDSLGVSDEVIEGVGVAPEIHQRQVGSELHPVLPKRVVNQCDRTRRRVLVNGTYALGYAGATGLT